MTTGFRYLLFPFVILGLAIPTQSISAQSDQTDNKQAPAQASTDDKTQTPAKQVDKDRKRRERALEKELASPYKKWLEEDVVYIITPEERGSFLRLSTNEEREQFIENFWLRRNPDPDSPENTFKEEHYRRIAYTNEHYASGIPGWKTDRGRIYIMWGPPDEVESHPSGGSYERPAQEGGGETSSYPFEDWRYRYLEGIGNDVNLEFVDPTMTGEFHLTMDPSEKDALLYVPGAGLTMMLSPVIDSRSAASRSSVQPCGARESIHKVGTLKAIACWMVSKVPPTALVRPPSQIASNRSDWSSTTRPAWP